MSVTKKASAEFECGGCCWVMGGYAKKELIGDLGWEFHEAGDKREFALCGDCVERFAIRREAAAAPA